MKNFLYLSLFAVLAVGFSSCVTDEVEIREEFYYPEELALIQQTLDLPEKPLDYNIVLPEHLSRSGLFARNVNKDMATLGRVLFYDKALSSTGEVSCASCHKQELAFADSKVASDGVDGETERNSLALGSVASFAAYYGNDQFGSFGVPFMWDNRFGTAREQAKAAFTSEVEMGLHIDELVQKVNELKYYEPLFRRAFGNTDRTEADILSAVAEFVDALGTFDSKFDRAAELATNGQDMSVSFVSGGFTEMENRGKNIYMESCASCHSDVFGRPVLNSANNGLEMNYSDEGIGGFTNQSVDMYTFKVPTLRNVGVSAPYMHDGRYATLEEVVDFYSEEVVGHPKLHEDLLNIDGTPRHLNLSDEDKAALVTFLHTLTDDQYLTEERYSDPFKQ